MGMLKRRDITIFFMGVVTAKIFSMSDPYYLGDTYCDCDDDDAAVAHREAVSPAAAKKASSVSSAFDRMVSQSYQAVASDESQTPRVRNDLASFERAEVHGGLMPEDLIMLNKTYSSTQSLFEYGLGESTFLASHLGVPRYAGVDSDAAWVSQARDKSLQNFRFYFGE
jgi:hypothetical protein